jgi:hypothetical protein
MSIKELCVFVFAANTCRPGTQVKTSKNLSARNDYCFSSEMPLYYRTANKIKKLKGDLIHEDHQL